jgi:adenylate cyclase
MERSEIERAGLLDGIEEEALREERVKLVRHLLGEGFELEELQEAARLGRLTLLPMDRIFQRDSARYTAVEIAEKAGLPLELIRRLWRSLGLADADDTAVVYSETDLEAAKTVGQFHAAGLAEEPLALISQVIGQGMSQLADTIREVAGEALLEAGDSEQTLGIRYAEATEQLVPMLTPLLGYILGVHLREQIKADIVSQVELTTGRWGAREVTVCFADLVGFTRLGEGEPAATLGSAGRELSRLAVEAARPPVRLVKMIGDAAMLVSPEPGPLVRAALGLVAECEQLEQMPSLRAGIASGAAISQSGDWFGAPVNLASRVTSAARPGSVLVAKPVRDAAKEAFSFSFAGSRRFKGVRDEVRLYRVRVRANPDRD